MVNIWPEYNKWQLISEAIKKFAFLCRKTTGLTISITSFTSTVADSFTSFLGLKVSKCSRSFYHFVRSPSESECGLLSDL